MDEKTTDVFKQKSSEYAEPPLDKSLKYDADFDKNISKNLASIKRESKELNEELEKLNSCQNRFKANLFSNKEDFEEYASKNFDDLKSYESDLKKKFSKVFKPTPHSLRQDENLSDLKSLLLNDSEPRFVLQDTYASNRPNPDHQLTAKKQAYLLQQDYDSLKKIYECEEKNASKTCEAIAEKLKDCHIVYSSNKI